MLHVPGQPPVERRSDVRGVHSEALFRYIEELLAAASLRIQDIDAIAISAGPGSYTGLRIGASRRLGRLRAFRLAARRLARGKARSVVYFDKDGVEHEQEARVVVVSAA